MNSKIDINLFTMEKALSDLQWFLRTFAPCSSLLNINDEIPNIRFNVRRPTPTGLTPKNAVEAVVDFDGPDNIIAHLNYAADGAVNSVDLHLWRNHIGNSVTIRSTGDGFRITMITVHHPQSRQEDLRIYDINVATPNEDPINILDASVRSLGTPQPPKPVAPQAAPIEYQVGKSASKPLQPTDKQRPSKATIVAYVLVGLCVLGILGRLFGTA